MKFAANVEMSPSKDVQAELEKQASDMAEMKHHLFSALRILHREDDSVLDEIEAFLRKDDA